MCVRDTGLSVRETVRDTQAARRRSSIREASLVQFFDPTQTSADNGSATVLSSAINLCNTLMGTGLLAMPGVSTYDANMHDANMRTPPPALGPVLTPASAATAAGDGALGLDSRARAHVPHVARQRVLGRGCLPALPLDWPPHESWRDRRQGAPPPHPPLTSALVWKWKGLPCQCCLRRRPAPPS